MNYNIFRKYVYTAYKVCLMAYCSERVGRGFRRIEHHASHITVTVGGETEVKLVLDVYH